METDVGGSSSGLLSPGSYLRDRWEILKKIGGGGFGEIYKAQDHVTHSVLIYTASYISKLLVCSMNLLLQYR